ncbi:hypothetical protein AK830_g5722 [Neonectria ditissima]|uniref:CN hydrolase domain-containing protein n=1 Tax=Neonectria ditissima TaxID=78410 RepID=A0A0P7BL93_9HYPO|nr:hypothetical protein AK830_g5722 [Neonectria ditissima]
MRIACLQFAPQVGDVDNNLNRADSVLSKANPDDLDLLVLPEMAFSGYNFKSLQDITPFLEPSGSGITSLWSRTIALKYNCNVVVGYPEKVDVSPKWPTSPEYYNSAIVVNGDGETIANYRKNFLYYTDETWALEGNRGFYEGFIPGLGNTSMGICMDINPRKFEAPWHAFEFAFHVLEMESNLVIVSMAWMTREDPRQFTRMPNEPDMETLTYWVTRLEPIIRSDNDDEIIVVFCNRTGSEDEALYAGTSAVVGIQAGEVKVYGILGRGEKELLVVDTNADPYAKLLYRPDAGNSVTESPVTLQKQSDLGKLDSKHNHPKYPVDANRCHEHQLTTPGDEGNQRLVSASSKQSFLPPATSTQSIRLKELALRELTSESSERRQASVVTIPHPLDLSKANFPRSPGGESFNIPTPSAPSPTPMAIRPRLVIPASPPILPHQYPPDHPMSAASLRSEASIQSVRSDESEASIQTVRSNPRPPEESTPYPHNATPLSGYPANAFAVEKRIYGGYVTFEAGGDISLDKAINDLSPISPRWRQWRQGEVDMETPISAGTWTCGTPMWRKPEPFPWPAITSATTPRPPSRSAIDDYLKETATPQESQRPTSPYAQSNSSSNRTNKTNKSTKSETSLNSGGTVQVNPKRDRSIVRPPSTKSRNVSRSGGNERSNSVLGERDTSTPISVNKKRDEGPSGIQCPERPPSTKSRGHSRNRPEDVVDSEQDHHLIHIAASPAILKNTRSHHRSVSRANTHQRSNSFATGGRTNAVANNERSSTPTSDKNKPRPGSRATSRGRTLGRNISSTSGNPNTVVGSSERASSADSTRNDLLHSRIQGLRTQSGQTRSDRPSSSQGARRPSQGGDPSEFERVEAVNQDHQEDSQGKQLERD